MIELEPVKLLDMRLSEISDLLCVQFCENKKGGKPFASLVCNGKCEPDGMPMELHITLMQGVINDE